MQFKSISLRVYFWLLIISVLPMIIMLMGIEEKLSRSLQ